MGQYFRRRFRAHTFVAGQDTQGLTPSAHFADCDRDDLGLESVALPRRGGALLALGGVPFLLWGVFFRVTMGLHVTWMVNSLTHFWGRRRFATRDDSRNNWFVALLSFGEGWHNNHHAHPTSARHGLAWYEIDMSWMTIRLLQTVGLAKAVRVARSYSSK